MDQELENNFVVVVCLFILFSFLLLEEQKAFFFFFFRGGGGEVFKKFKRQKIDIKGNTICNVLGVKWLF